MMRTFFKLFLAMIITITGVAFFIVAAYQYLSLYLPTWQVALLLGGVFMLVAFFILVSIDKQKKRPRPATRSVLPKEMEDALQYLDEARRLIRKHPGMSVASAFALGYAIGPKIPWSTLFATALKARR